MLSALYKTTLAAALLLTGSVTTAAGYPEDYRSWTHVKTLTLHAGHPLEVPFKGIHHVYANPAALEGLGSGNYPDGAVLVFDLLLLGALVASKGTHGGDWLPYLLLLNPTDVFRLANLAGFEAARSYTGLAAVATGPLFEPAVLTGILAAWVAAPLATALWLFRWRRI